MENVTRRDLFKKLAAIIPAAAAAFVLTQDAQAGVSPYYSGNTVDYNRTPDRFPNVVLTTHEGKKVKFYDDLVKNKIVLINFFYAQCEKQCPTNTANLRRVQRKLGEKMGREIFFLSITLLTSAGFFDAMQGLIRTGIETLGRAHVAFAQFLGSTLLSAILDNNIVADFPLCNKSFNCSYSVHDL